MDDRRPGPALHSLMLVALALCLACASCHGQTPAAQAQDPVALNEQKLEKAQAAHDTKAEILELDMLGGLSGSRDQQKALDYFARALALARDSKGHASEAFTQNRTSTAYLTFGQKENALDELSQALAIEVELNDRKAQADTIEDRGLVYYFMGERQKALDNFNQALRLLREVGAPREEATVLSEIGGVCYQIGEPRKALEYYSQALPTLRKLHAANLATVLGGIGTAHSELGQGEEALQYLNEALATARAAGQHGSEAAQLNNLSTVYGRLGQTQRSLEYLLEAIAVDRQWGNLSTLASEYDNLGTTYLDLGDNTKALDAFNKALAAQANLHEPLRDARIKYGMARLFLMTKQPEKAVLYYSQALALFHAMNDHKDESAAMLFLGLAYEYFGRSQDALSVELASLSLAKTLDDPDMQGKTESTLMEYFRRKKQHEVAIFFGREAVNSFQQIRGQISRLDKTLQTSFTQSKSRILRSFTRWS